MFQRKLNEYNDLPVKEQSRKCTDIICTIISAIFALTLFILAFCFMNKDNYFKTNFPTDSDNRPCSFGVNEQYSYVYFPDINDPSIRVCVSTCPKKDTVEIECSKNSKVPSCLSVHIYESEAQVERLGGFCMPTNEQEKDVLIEKANLKHNWEFMNDYDVIRLSLIFSLLMGIIWMALTQCIPKNIAILAMGLASLMLLGLGVLFLVHNDEGWANSPWRIITACILILFAIFFAVMICLYKRRIKVTGVLLHYAAVFLSSQPVNFIFIPIFLACSVGLIVLCLFQYLAFSSRHDPVVVEDEIYLHSKRDVALTVLTLIEFIWGLQFLKDTFNFFISGNAAQWYMKGNRGSNCCIPVSRFFKYNFGSVAGGSFLNAFFNFIDFLFEALRCYPEGCCGVCAPLCTGFSSCCGCFFDLVRNDTYAYINLTGIPYCNAARNCETLCQNSRLFIGSQSAIFFYRLCAHVFCISTVLCLSYWLMESKTGEIKITSLLLIILLSYMVVTYFIDIHADAGEALQISYLSELELKGGNPEKLSDNHDGLKGEMRGLEKSHKDGAC